MAGNDPTETGGLFIGRRPGTAPLRYRGTPTPGGSTRRRADAVLAFGILVLETLLLTTLWGPQPAAWLWVGSQVFHETDSVGFGIFVAFVGMLFTILATLKAAKYPGVLLFAALLFCQSGNESSIGGWTSTYAGTIGASPFATFSLGAPSLCANDVTGKAATAIASAARQFSRR